MLSVMRGHPSVCLSGSGFALAGGGEESLLTQSFLQPVGDHLTRVCANLHPCIHSFCGIESSGTSMETYKKFELKGASEGAGRTFLFLYGAAMDSRLNGIWVRHSF